MKIKKVKKVKKVNNGTETFTSNFYDGEVTGSTQFFKESKVNMIIVVLAVLIILVVSLVILKKRNSKD